MRESAKVDLPYFLFQKIKISPFRPEWRAESGRLNFRSFDLKWEVSGCGWGDAFGSVAGVVIGKEGIIYYNADGVLGESEETGVFELINTDPFNVSSGGASRLTFIDE